MPAFKVVLAVLALAMTIGPLTAREQAMPESITASHRGIWPAPVGHRQPTHESLVIGLRDAAYAQSETDESAVLKAIAGVCRGC